MPVRFRYLIATAATLFSVPAISQNVTLPAATSCPTCRLALTKHATLGLGDSGFVRSEPIWMSRDSRGRLYVTWQNYGHGPELPAIYDSAGNFMQELGRKGDGPGEFNYAVTVNVDARGKILVWDMNNRETVLDGDYRLVRQYFQRAATLVILPDGRRVTNYSAPDAFNNPAPVSVYDTLGKVLAAFGAVDVPTPDNDAWRANRAIGSAQGDAVWVARTDMYRLERWSTKGHLTNVFSRSAPWFPVTRVRSVGEYGAEPTPVVRAVREDAQGRLWFVVSVPARNWKQFLGPPRLTAGRPPSYPQRVRSALYDTMIDVIDVRTGKLLVSQRVPGMMQFILNDELVASYRQDSEGTPIIDVWRVRFVQ